MPSQGSALSPKSRSEGACRQHARYALLLGTSLLVFAAFPSPALAQNECGPPPPGGGTIVCPPGSYPGGISYTAQPADLTIVLPAGVNAGDTVELTASAAGVDLRLDGAAGATIVTSGANSNGIFVYSTDGSVQITSDTVRTSGTNSRAVTGYSSTGPITVASTSVTTSGDRGYGIVAIGRGDVAVTSGTLVTTGHSAEGLHAASTGGGATVISGTLSTRGNNASGIDVEVFRDITVISGTLSTAGDFSTGIFANAGGTVTISSTNLVTTGPRATGIAATGTGDVVIASGTLATHGTSSNGIGSAGIRASSRSGNLAVTSGTLSTDGNDAPGITASAEHGNVTVNSGSITTQGSNSIAINAFAENDVTVTSGSVSTVGPNSTGIFGQSLDGDLIVTSGSVSAAGPNSTGIFGLARDGDVIVTSGSASTAGPDSTGILAWSLNGDVIVTSGSVSTAGLNSTGISALSNGGDATIISTGPVIATGWGIQINAHGGNATSTSTDVTTSGAISFGILVSASSVTGSATVTSTGTVRTSGGPFSDGINVSAPDRVVITSATVITTGTNSTGIRGIEGRGGGSGGLLITSGSVTTSGAHSPAIDGFASAGDVEIFSTGTVTTTGYSSAGIIAISNGDFATVDANAVSVTGTGGATAILIGSVTASTVTIRGLVESTNGFEVTTGRGAATVNTTATGIIRGAVDLGNNADRVNNAGLFDAIGTSLFRAGSDVFNNSGTIRSANGAAVLDALETFNNGGRVEMRDDDAGDTLDVTGAFIGSGASRLGVDANLAANQADVLITGAATGSTILDVNLLGNAVLNLTGTLVVDGGAGTSATAFTVAGGVQSNPYVALGLLFDAPNNNFLLVGLPGQPAFEAAVQAEMIGNFWSQGTDAVSAQLEAARDGEAPPAGGNLTGGGGLGGWVQLLAGNIERDASQSFANGGNTTLFDTSYEQDFEGVQGGLDYQSGGTILGITFGAGRSDATFEQSFSRVELDGYNAGAYAAFRSGGFFFNAIAKVDWVDAEAAPGAGVLAEFDATAWGLRGAAGYRFAMGNLYLEPSASLSWVNVDIDDYVSNGATVAFDDFTSLRGAAGVRFGGAFRSGNGLWSPFVGIYAIDEFEGDARSNFTLDQTIGLQQDAPGTFGELAAGLNYSTGRLEAFVRGEVDFGGGREGLSGRAGARIRF